jgi:hypothetical protein
VSNSPTEASSPFFQFRNFYFHFMISLTLDTYPVGFEAEGEVSND